MKAGSGVSRSDAPASCMPPAIALPTAREDRLEGVKADGGQPCAYFAPRFQAYGKPTVLQRDENGIPIQPPQETSPMVRVLLILGAAALSLLLLISPALAQPAGAQAEVMFRQARELMTAGKTAEACDAFAQSQQLEPAVTTLINLAACREKNNQLATAWGLFLEAERQTRAGTDDASRQLHDVAQNRAEAIEPRVSKLSINVPDHSRIDGLEIRRGSDLVQTPMWNRALPIDGGTYKISARAPGTTTWSAEVTIAPEGDTKTVDLPDLRTLPRDLPSGGPTVAEPAQPRPAPTPKPTQSASQRSLVLPVGFGAGALVLGVAALGFELSGRSTYEAAKTEPDYDRAGELWSSANTRRHIGQVAGIASLACAGVATYFLLRTPARSSSPGVSVLPVAGASFAGLQLDGSW